jgi:short-subunit dehydrogenase
MKPKGVNVTALIPGSTATALYNTDNLNIPMLIRLGIMKKPDAVANAGVRALFKNYAECIPGFLNKLIVVLLPIVPHFIISLLNRRIHL